MQTQEIKKPTAIFETITPMMAKSILAENKNNRPIDDRLVQQLVTEMNTKNFHVTGESIKIDWDGNLIDGQHRLLAIVKTGISCQLLVVRGLDPNAFKFIDSGKKRTAADCLAVEKAKHPGNMAALIKFCINYERGNIFQAASAKSDRGKSATNSQVVEYWDKHQVSLQESWPYGFNKHNKVISGVTLAGSHYILKKISEEQADEFCHKLASGEELSKDSPIYQLRQAMLNDMRSRTMKMKPLVKLALLFKAWNFYRQKKKVTALRWESAREAFPKPV